MAGNSEIKLSVSKLNNSNYQLWKFKVEMLLSRDDLWDVTTNERQQNDDQNWDKKNRQAKATISLLVEDDQLIHIRHEDTAKGMWDVLKRIHERSSLNSKLFLLRKLYQMRLGREQDMQEHINAMLEVITQLRSIGENVTDSHAAAILLCSLPDTYTALINALETRPETDITLAFVKTRLIDEHQRRKELNHNRTETDTRTALKATDTRLHRKETRECFRCHKQGHIKKDCTIWKAEQARQRPSYNKQRVKNATHDSQEGRWNATFKATGDHEHKNWCIDSGATSHMTSDRSFFTKLDLDNKETIYLADGSKIHSEGYGHGTIICPNDAGHNLAIPVKDVLYVPSLEGGLLSVKRLTANGLIVKFQGDQCSILNGKQTVAIAKLNDHLYHLNTVREKVRLCTHKHKDCIHTWHRRLGHRHPECIQELQRKNLTKDLTVSPCPVTVKCECCIRSKAIRATLPKVSQKRASKPLDLIHSDVCGPLNPPTPGDNRYILTFIDDYSRYTVTYLLQHKSQVFEKLQEYIAKASNKFQRKPLTLRSDNGGEFTGQKIQEYLKQNGIEHQKTVPYTPEQNGVAERKNRTLTEMIRCMLTDSGLSQKYWGEAAITATYLQNRLPSRSLQKTPYELWNDEKPSVKHLRVFGCKAFIYTPEEKRTKLQNRATEGIFVGYSDDVKGYRILNPKTDKVTISNSVTFIEDLRDNVMTAEEVRTEEETDQTTSTNTEQIVEVNAELTNTEEPTPESSVTALRRSTRENKGKPPTRLSYKASTTNTNEPATWEDISQLPEREANKWIKAAEEELKSMHDTKTWTLTELPPGRKAIGNKWTFKVKHNADGTIERYKARLVAKGYSQKYGEDYDETFAPVVKHTTIRTLLTVVATRKMQAKHLDVKTAFLHGELTEEIYMEQPQGFKDEQRPDLVCKLHRSIYGLKQAARAWNIKINEVLTQQDFQRSKADPCLYTKKLANRWIYLLIYVDDILICFEQEGDEAGILNTLNQNFETKDLGDVKYYLGVQIEREEDGSFLLNQRHKIREIIETFKMEDAKPAKFPMENNYLKGMYHQDNLLPSNTQYKKAIGKLLYITTATRPDIAASVGILCRKVSAPTQMDWNAVKRVIRYLKGTLHYKLKLPASDNCTLSGYVDADYAGDTSDRKSTSGYLFLLSGGTISWTSKKSNFPLAYPLLKRNTSQPHKQVKKLHG